MQQACFALALTVWGQFGGALAHLYVIALHTAP